MRAITYFNAYKQCRDELSWIKSTPPMTSIGEVLWKSRTLPKAESDALLANFEQRISPYAQLLSRRERLAQKLAHRLEAMLGEN